MSAYTPPAAGDFNDGDPLDPAKTLAGFTTLQTAVNGAVNAANLTLTGEFDATRFQPGGGRIIVDERNESLVEIMLPVLRATTSFLGSKTNVYDVVGTGARFYLHAATKTSIRSRVQLLKGKHVWLGVQTATYQVTGTLVVDGASSESKTVTFFIDPAAASSEARGLTMDFQMYQLLSAGAHTVHVRLDWSVSTTTHAAADDNGAEWYGTGARTTVVACVK